MDKSFSQGTSIHACQCVSRSASGREANRTVPPPAVCRLGKFKRSHGLALGNSLALLPDFHHGASKRSYRSSQKSEENLLQVGVESGRVGSKGCHCSKGYHCSIGIKAGMFRPALNSRVLCSRHRGDRRGAGTWVRFSAKDRNQKLCITPNSYSSYNANRSRCELNLPGLRMIKIMNINVPKDSATPEVLKFGVVEPLGLSC